MSEESREVKNNALNAMIEIQAPPDDVDNDKNRQKKKKS